MVASVPSVFPPIFGAYTILFEFLEYTCLRRGLARGLTGLPGLPCVGEMEIPDGGWLRESLRMPLGE